MTKQFLMSKRFWALGVGLAIHVLVLAGQVPEGSEGVLNESVANIVALVLDFVGTIFAFRGGPALSVSK